MLGLADRLGFKKHQIEEDTVKVLLNLDSTS